MTKQETFDAIVSHLRKQGEKAQHHIISPSSEESWEPAYYAADGRRCAVGCLIPETEYQSNWEGVGVLSIYLQCPSLQQHDSQLLCDLQEVHDSCDTDDWESQFAKIAKIHNLDPN